MIRRARPSDAEAIKDLWAAFADEQRWPARPTLAAAERLVETAMCWVVLNDGELVGCTAARIGPSYFNETFEIMGALFVGVRSDQRGVGYGADLIDALEQEADARKVYLAVNAYRGPSVSRETLVRRGYVEHDTQFVRAPK